MDKCLDEQESDTRKIYKEGNRNSNCENHLLNVGSTYRKNNTGKVSPGRNIEDHFRGNLFLRGHLTSYEETRGQTVHRDLIPEIFPKYLIAQIYCSIPNLVDIL